MKDDIKAMQELNRILSVNGCGILVVPIDLTCEQIDEDPDCMDIGERWRRFGQGDHIRKYSKKGFYHRASSIFSVEEYGKNDFGTEAMHENSLLDTSTIYIVRHRKGDENGNV